MADYQRELLNQLMGVDRNKSSREKPSVRKHWSDDDVSFLYFFFFISLFFFFFSKKNENRSAGIT